MRWKPYFLRLIVAGFLVRDLPEEALFPEAFNVMFGEKEVEEERLFSDSLLFPKSFAQLGVEEEVVVRQSKIQDFENSLDVNYGCHLFSLKAVSIMLSNNWGFAVLKDNLSNFGGLSHIMQLSFGAHELLWSYNWLSQSSWVFRLGHGMLEVDFCCNPLIIDHGVSLVLESPIVLSSFSDRAGLVLGQGLSPHDLQGADAGGLEEVEGVWRPHFVVLSNEVVVGALGCPLDPIDQGESGVSSDSVVKKKQGRPRSAPSRGKEHGDFEVVSSALVSKKRGRPRKVRNREKK